DVVGSVAIDAIGQHSDMLQRRAAAAGRFQKEALLLGNLLFLGDADRHLVLANAVLPRRPDLERKVREFGLRLPFLLLLCGRRQRSSDQRSQQDTATDGGSHRFTSWMVKRIGTSLRKPRSCVPCPTSNANVASRLPASRARRRRTTYSTSCPLSVFASGGAVWTAASSQASGALLPLSR